MERITKARAALVLSQPFFASLALRLGVVEDLDCRTMATDGRSLFYDPAFVEALPFDQLVGVLAHETLHLACAHHARRGERDPGLWNRAADLAINPVVLSAGLALPEGALVEPRFADMSAEAIYAALAREGGAGSGRDGLADPGGCGAVLDATDEDGGTASPADLSAAEQEWKVATFQAAQAAKAQGRLPAALARLVEELKKPKLDWRDLLRRFVQAASRSDYRWTPPNRRFVASGLYLPSLVPDGLGEIAVVVDTSGSISEDELAAFAAEINGIVEDSAPERVHVIYCDAEVQRADEIEIDAFPLRLEAIGGGGTDFRPPFAWLERHGIAPSCLVYLSDLYGPFPETEPAYPVLWVSTSPQTAPWGETIRLSD